MRKIIFFTLIIGIAIGLFIRSWLGEEEVAAKIVTIKSRNLEFQVATRAKTVGELLGEQGYKKDVILNSVQDLPGQEKDFDFRQNEDGKGIINGIIIDLRHPLNIILTDAGNTRVIQTTAETVGDLLNIEKIGLAVTDQVKPPLDSFLGEGTSVTVDRIVDLEVTETSDVVFAINIEYDPESYYGQEQIERLGVLGRKEQSFLITYKNGVEIKRKLLSEKILQNPQTEFRHFGTKIEVENVEEGRASWYAYKGCTCAAHPYFDLGRWVRVTAINTGKSIIVRINDRGPVQAIHPDRVIDLDSTVFKQLAPLVSGTIAVKVELLR